jgi:hypothetical protein
MNSQITVPTIKGSIKASFIKSGSEKETFTFDIPEGIDADFVIPSETFRTVHVNKKKTSAGKGTLKLKPGHYEIEIRK